MPRHKVQNVPESPESSFDELVGGPGDELNAEQLKLHSYSILSQYRHLLKAAESAWTIIHKNDSTASETISPPAIPLETDDKLLEKDVIQEKHEATIDATSKNDIFEPSETLKIPSSNLSLVSPQNAPGYSLIAQTMRNSLSSQSGDSNDPIEGWEFVVPSPSIETRSDYLRDGLHADSISPLNRRASFLENRASALVQDVEDISKRILGDNFLSTTGLSMPSITFNKPTSGPNSSSPTSSQSSSLNANQHENVVSEPSLLLRNVRAVEILRTESKYLQGIEHVLRHALGPLQEAAGVESSTMKMLLSSGDGGSSSPATSSFSPMTGVVVPVLSKEEVKTIFGNLESLYVTNCNLFSNLVSIFRDWNEKTSTLGQLIAYYAPLLKVAYSVYLSELSNALANVSILCKKKADFANFLKVFSELKESEKRPLSDFLSTPLQRITRYEILLAALRRETPDDHPDAPLLDQAIDIVSKTLKKINASPIDVERRAKMIELQTRFAPGEIIVDPARLLILEEELMTRKITENHFSKHHVFLFTDCILTATVSYYGYLYKHNLLDLHSLVIMDREYTGNNENEKFSVWLLHPMQTYIFCLPSLDKKNQWMSSIAVAIAQLISQSPDREKTRNQFSLHIMTNNIPILIPNEAEKNPSHPAWAEIKTLQAQSNDFFSTIWSWFTP